MIGCCSDRTLSTESPLETVQPEREQTSGSKNLRRMGKYALRSDPMEGNRSWVFRTTANYSSDK